MSHARTQAFTQNMRACMRACKILYFTYIIFYVYFENRQLFSHFII